jgi:hypothetical protein
VGWRVARVLLRSPPPRSLADLGWSVSIGTRIARVVICNDMPLAQNERVAVVLPDLAATSGLLDADGPAEMNTEEPLVESVERPEQGERRRGVLGGR